MPKNMYTVAGDGPCNEELALRIQAGDKSAAERLISQNEGYLTGLARAYTPWCETEDLKQEAALALLDAAGHFDPTHGTKLLTYATPVMEAALIRTTPHSILPLCPFPSAGTINCAGWHTSVRRDVTHLMLS
ncbi:MAG: sigma factor [Dysosmobacter sp.]